MDNPEGVQRVWPRPSYVPPNQLVCPPTSKSPSSAPPPHPPAIAAGAARIELNAAGSYPAGGLTPSLDDVADLKDAEVPVRVMIRPRGPLAGLRDFLYSSDEIDEMVQSIEAFKASGAMRVERGDGFVFGALTKTEMWGPGRIVLQVETVQRLVAASRPYKTVFHRAFDVIVGDAANDGTQGGAAEWENALASLIHMGVDGILTSGGPGNAAQNVATLKEVMAKASDNTEIIVGGGVRSGNVGELCSKLDMGRGGRGGGDGKESWIHSSCLTGRNDEIDVAEVQKILGEIK
ncbi:Copper homeostasis protein cutC-like protein [Apiospora rasikravindrae]|uniref:Copper homeostasis protein cutC homolog n=1 Tax=Apiospora rasikravindrae TaxID=990691 RepID=A0ABR1SDU1_9PEZI